MMMTEEQLFWSSGHNTIEAGQVLKAATYNFNLWMRTELLTSNVTEVASSIDEDQFHSER